MNQKLNRIYTEGSRKNHKSTAEILKKIAAVSPSVLLLGALPTASQSQVLSDVGLVCNSNQSQACDLADVNHANSVQISSSFGGVFNSNPITAKTSFGFSYQPVDMDCDGDDEFQLWAGGVALEANYTTGNPVADYVVNGALDFTNLSSGAAFGFDLTYSSPGGALYGPPSAVDCANSASVNASNNFRSGAGAFGRFNSAQSGTFLGSNITASVGPIPIGSTGYIPVTFDSGGNTHFGWVELQTNAAGAGQILNTVYNPVPNEGVTIACDACDINAIPTAGEWGLISLGLLLLSFGTTMIIRKEGVLATDQGSFSLGFNKPLYNAGLFKKSLLIALGLGVCLSVGSVLLTGTLTMTDIIGGAIATPILAYWLHLIGMYKNEEI